VCSFTCPNCPGITQVLMVETLAAVPLDDLTSPEPMPPDSSRLAGVIADLSTTERAVMRIQQPFLTGPNLSCPTRVTITLYCDALPSIPEHEEARERGLLGIFRGLL